MNLERIAMIRNHLRDNVQDIDFNLGEWGGGIGRPFDPDSGCGTVCCAVGHSTNIPEFQALGFKLVASGPSSQRANICWDNHGYSWDAVEQFLEITQSKAEHLFFAGEYPNGRLTTRQEVIDRLTEFLTTHSA